MSLMGVESMLAELQREIERVRTEMDAPPTDYLSEQWRMLKLKRGSRRGK